MDLTYLKENFPRESALATGFATQAVLEVEKLDGKESHEKQALAEQLAQAYARDYYRSLDQKNDYPWWIDEGVEFLIKIFPMVIKEIVMMLNSGGGK